MADQNQLPASVLRSERIERANQALTKLNNYAVVHSDVIDASWIVKVIEEVRAELSEAPRKPSEDLEEETCNSSEGRTDSAIVAAAECGTAMNANSNSLKHCALCHGSEILRNEIMAELREAEAPRKPSTDEAMRADEREKVCREIEEYAAHRTITRGTIANAVKRAREVSQHPVPAPRQPSTDSLIKLSSGIRAVEHIFDFDPEDQQDQARHAVKLLKEVNAELTESTGSAKPRTGEGT